MELILNATVPLVDVETKHCTQCGNDKPVDDFYYRQDRQHYVSRCKVCERQNTLERYDNTIQRKQILKRKYGLTPDDYEQYYYEQDGVCAICQEECSTGKSLAVDHDHQTDEVRGLLCGKCNLGIGYFRDSPALLQKAIDYLEKEDIKI